MRGVLSVLVVGVLLCPASPAADPNPEAAKIGDVVDSLQFKDRLFLPRELSDFDRAKVIVIVASNTTCPIVQKYWPKLVRLHEEFSPKDVQFLALNTQHGDSIVDISAQAVKFDVPFPLVKDIDGQCAARLGLSRTPEVVVLDAERRLRYRGRIDDQHRLGASTPVVRKETLRDAIAAVLAGRDPLPAETSVDGCLITPPPPVEGDPSLTWADDILPLFNTHCNDCHRSGTEAPFGLQHYDDAVDNSEMIAEVIRDRRMPPWYGASEFTEFVNHRGLTSEERHQVHAWIQGGMKRGETTESEPAAPPTVPVGWRLGEPNQILRTTEEHELPADGYVDYRYSVLPYVFSKDTWVSKIEILPDNPEVVHHANLLAFQMDQGIRSAYFVTGRVPGAEPMETQDGVAVLIPKGTVLALQIHFTTTGKKERCRLAVGLHYADGHIDKSLRHVLISSKTFAIPPGDPFHRVVKSETLEHDITGFGLFTHMHVRGRDMTYIAHYPDGTSETLLMIPNYNFDWQIGYEWARGSRKFPKGTRIECIAHFDNSEFNPFNPDPTETVREGQQTYHEMMYGFLFYTIDEEHLDLDVEPETGVAVNAGTGSGS